MATVVKSDSEDAGFCREINYQLFSLILVYIYCETEYLRVFLLRELRSGKTLELCWFSSSTHLDVIVIRNKKISYPVDTLPPQRDTVQLEITDVRWCKTLDEIL